MRTQKKIVLLVTTLLVAVSLNGFAATSKKVVEKDSGSDVNPIMGYTHLLPSPYTLPMGRFAIGTNVAFGVTDFFQVGSNILRDFYKMYNVNAKLNILKFDSFAFALTGGYETYNYQDIFPTNPDIQVTTLQPGMVESIAFSNEFAWLVGGNLSFLKGESKSVLTSGYVHGANVGSDISWAYNPQRKGIGNVLSTGITYDITYKLFGYGISHHFPGLQLGIHYFPAATRYKFLPIINGGAVIDL